MSLSILLYSLILLPLGCAGTKSSDSGGVVECTALGTYWNEAQQSTTWTTETADAAANPLNVRRWKNATRTELEEETRYEYDQGGFLIRLSWDTNGDGNPEVAEVWERAADGLVTAHVQQVYAESGEPRTSYRQAYTYEDGLLVYSETDFDGDGVIESSRSYTYESRRVVREEAYLGDEVEGVVVWTYPDPAPSLDCIETRMDPEGNVTATYTRIFDENGDLLSEEELRNGERSVTTNTWDNSQLMLAERVTDDFYSFWQYAYDEHGLMIYRRYDGDTGRDGVIEQANLDTWEWTCP